MEWLTSFISSGLSSASDASPAALFGSLFAAYIGGILSSLTPCVYPMIPITVGVIGGTTPKEAHPGALLRRRWRDLLTRALVYVAGMAVVYSFLGVLAGLTGRVFGSFTNRPGWYIGLGIVMTFSALMMMDVIPIDPAVWVEKFKRVFLGKRPGGVPHAHEHDKEMGLLGAFALGVSSGLIASPCTTPVLTSILAFITQTQSVLFGMALMLSFSLGLGTFLVLIAISTGALQILPKSGAWMKTVKMASGLLLLAFGEYLIFKAGRLG